ncbi:acyl-CoA thioesterase [Endozoicomonadaceae bacterium StTr2]
MIVTFDALMEQVSRNDEGYTVEMSSNWSQGRASFGGLLAALGVRAMQLESGDDRPLRSIQVSFIGPVGEGEISIAVQQLRTGKNVTHMQASLSQNGEVGCVVNACFGVRRDSVINVEAPLRPELPDPESLVALPFIPGVTPNFTGNFSMRWAKGSLPYSGKCEAQSGIWTRFNDGGPASVLHLIAIADIPPTPVITFVNKPVPTSSLTWMLDIIVDDLKAESNGWWYVETTVDHAAEGYAHQGYSIYEPGGSLVASGRQVATVFA